MTGIEMTNFYTDFAQTLAITKTFHIPIAVLAWVNPWRIDTSFMAENWGYVADRP